MTAATISSGQTVSSAKVSSGNSEIVLSGGTSIDPTVSAGGFLLVSAGGEISGATVLRQDLGASGLISMAGGTAIDTLVANGGILDVTNGIASGTTIIAGGSQVIGYAEGDGYSISGSAIGTTINCGH